MKAALVRLVGGQADSEKAEEKRQNVREAEEDEEAYVDAMHLVETESNSLKLQCDRESEKGGVHLP